MAKVDLDNKSGQNKSKHFCSERQALCLCRAFSLTGAFWYAGPITPSGPQLTSAPEARRGRGEERQGLRVVATGA